MSETQFGPYLIKKRLGSGGMATVYQGHDPRFKRDVAVKVMRRETLQDPTFRARFQREAQALARLEHTAIVHVYDYGEVSGTPYLVMQLMSGGSLANRLIGGPLPLAEVSRIIGRIAPALDQAHSLGIIHRDLKPDNILFDQYDEPHISDFGLVKLTEIEGTALTSAGISMGTPAYMSPEQVTETSEVDPRSDLYALGVIVYEMLTGKRPYTADTPMALAIKHVTDPVPQLLEASPGLPADLAAVIDKALAKNPDDRYQSAGDMARDLMSAAAAASGEGLEQSQKIQQAPSAAATAASSTAATMPAPAKSEAKPRSGRRSPLIIGAIVILAVLCLGAAAVVLGGGGGLLEGILGGEATATATAPATSTPRPVATATRTPIPSATAPPATAAAIQPTRRATSTPVPEATPDEEGPLTTPTLRPTFTPSPTTGLPTWTPTSRPQATATPAPVNTSPPAQPTNTPPPAQPTNTIPPPPPTLPPPPTP